MKVTTIDGGFRGGLRGAIATERRLALEEIFSRAVSPLYATYDQVVEAAATGQLPAYSAHQLTERYGPLADRIESHLNRASALETESDVSAWERQARAIEREVTRYVRDARLRLGYESASRPLQIAFIALTSIALLGGGAWVLVQATKPTRRKTRRRPKRRSRARSRSRSKRRRR